MTPKGREEERLGGAPVYAASAQTLGAVGTGIVSCVGTDFDDIHVAHLASCGIVTTGLYRRGPHSTQIITTESEDGSRSQDAVSVASKIEGKDLHREHLSASTIYFSPTISEVSCSCLKAAAGSEAIVALEVAGCLRTVGSYGALRYSVPDDIDDFLAYTTVLLVDPLSLSLLTESASEKDSVESLLGRGPFIVIVNRDVHGSTVYCHHGAIDIPYVVPSRVVDMSGYSHMYMIGFLIEFLRSGGELSRSGHFGAACASVSSAGRGPFAVISRYEVERLLRSLY
ncbi:MAG: carbohydrate kinase family protein [Candidatus Thorarchaeota archaeon]|nr:carbohydrate kinase family protein [Candidatus Thorarchaeota archaeon]